MAPSGAEKGAARLAPKPRESASICSGGDEEASDEWPAARRRKLATRGELCANLHQSASRRTKKPRAKTQVRLARFKPATRGPKTMHSAAQR